MVFSSCLVWHGPILLKHTGFQSSPVDFCYPATVGFNNESSRGAQMKIAAFEQLKVAWKATEQVKIPQNH